MKQDSDSTYVFIGMIIGAIVALLILSSCTPEPEPKPKDQSCLDGWLVDSLDNDHVRLFCESAYFDHGMLNGYDCSGFYAASPQAVGNVTLVNAVRFPTKCFNRSGK